MRVPVCDRGCASQLIYQTGLIFRQGDLSIAAGLNYLIAESIIVLGQANFAHWRGGQGQHALNYCGIRKDFLDFTVDRNPHKHGRFTPGMHIPMHGVGAIECGPAGLCAHPAVEPARGDRASDDAARRRLGRQILVPIPEVEVIDPRELNS
jgi:C-methyltransferase C-terminal domain